jgi:hypothetical protein
MVHAIDRRLEEMHKVTNGTKKSVKAFNKGQPGVLSLLEESDREELLHKKSS